MPALRQRKRQEAELLLEWFCRCSVVHRSFANSLQRLSAYLRQSLAAGTTNSRMNTAETSKTTTHSSKFRLPYFPLLR